MSKSSPLPSNTAASGPSDEDLEPDTAERSDRGTRRRSRRPLGNRVAAVARWLHIYLSMFGLASVLFFSVTGLTLNHPDWFFANVEHLDEAEGTLERSWLNDLDSATTDQAEDQVDQLRVVEYLRLEHDVKGALTEFFVDEYECFVTFKGPGYSADARIDRETGEYFLTESTLGLVAVLNDLHKGRDTGPVWSVAIDVSAVVLTVISLSGLILLFYLRLRRNPGLVVAVIGGVVIVAVVLLGIP
ncbi:PepSY-associated TM helix domain-containing protein [Tautonia rosea]|uniref:PepSY-associated TM helix domain-containing protein n=1 Tax=Tautonia rosea TaxID=2728037 RepID=UPI00147557BC|nr:PepSY-associated TM helix domain-containing protein [Tautonia rosea]